MSFTDEVNGNILHLFVFSQIFNGNAATVIVLNRKKKIVEMKLKSLVRLC